MSASNRSNYIMLILMITIGLDVMGLGLIFPIIPEAILDTSNHLFLPIHTDDSIRYFWYGIVMGVWPLGMFLGSTILGKLSDIYGRKKLLLISLLGVAISYFLSAIALHTHSLALFIISRFTVGIFDASFGLAQATIVDISPKDKLTKNLSFVTLAASIGFLVGPLLTTVIGLIFTGITQAILPFIIAGFLTIINLISIRAFLHETVQPDVSKPKPKLNIIDILFSFRIMFTDKRIQILAISFLLMQAGWGFYIQDFPLILSRVFDLSQAEIGLSFVLSALAYCLAIIGVLPFLEKQLTSKKLVIYSGFLLSITILVSVLIPTLLSQFITFTLASAFQLLFYSALLAWISKKVSDHEQGQIMGGTVSIFGLSWACNALLLGPLASWAVFLPIIIAVIILALSVLSATAVNDS